ncbi:PLP-dependent aminotransferase family protein [Deinococcus taeanensis]|uniref:aminotransferase-like domain-containing protein n=1 Tax=Deinococcus taeanensis TaxID=2737050 RepID=UPI001CDCA2AD|nr:PLP-dependent aminotransferase family protein [Deinococcus taeanensis]UBV42344.1 PLP-dependent aminotransferase family protein [Deinococcus taeanensis]
MPSPAPLPDAPRWAALLDGWRAAPGALHERLGERLRAAIERGELPPGARLPAERPLAALLGVSRATVVTALEDLTVGGWVTRRVGSGTHVASTAPRAAPLLTLRTPAAGVPTAELDFTIAVPLLTDRHRQQLREASLDAYRESVYHPHGLPDLRALLAETYTREGLPTRPEQVIVTSGAQQAIALSAATLLRRGDAALLETPTYFGAIDVVRAAGAKLIGVPVTPGGVNPDTFAALARTHGPRLAFLTPTYQNPTGTVLPAGARQRLAAFLHDAQLPTLEDDTLLDLGFTPAPAPPRLSALAPGAPVINVGSLSKLYWAGLRVGWMRLPPSLAAALAQAKTLADFGGSLPAQHTALHLLADLPGLIRDRREHVRPARDLLAQLLRTHLPDWTFTVPDGGQFLWVQLPRPHASAFTQHAARHGLRLFPGASMGVTPLADQYLRLPFTLDPAQLPEAVRRLQAAWTEFTARGGSERLA